MTRRILKIVFAISAIVSLLGMPYIGAIHMYGLSSDWNVEWLAALEWTLAYEWTVWLAAAIAVVSGAWLATLRFSAIERSANAKLAALASGAAETPHAPERSKGAGNRTAGEEVVSLLLTVYVQLLMIGFMVWLWGGKPENHDRIPIAVRVFFLIMVVAVAFRGYMIWRKYRRAGAHILAREESP